MNYARILVILVGMFFVLYGLLFTFLPVELSKLITDSSPASSSALIDTRATYGGMSLAVGLLFLLMARKDDTVRHGVIGVVMMVVCMAAGRLVGMVVDGGANGVMYLYLGLEILVAIVGLLLLPKANGKK